MKDTELHNLFKVAESREIKPEKIAEFLISNGCQIYVNFIKQISGKSGDSYNIRETGKFLSDLINEIKIKYEIRE